MTNNLVLLMDDSPSPGISPHSVSNDSRNESAPSTNSSRATKLYSDRLALFTVNVDPLVILLYGTATVISRDLRTSLEITMPRLMFVEIGPLRRSLGSLTMSGRGSRRV
ncbi:hypothetical protein V1523DRAFT_405004 [Lipomyces doorenjongii]